MELTKLSMEEIKSFDGPRMVEVEQDLRRDLSMLRMDIYTEKKNLVGKNRVLKRTLSRLLTIKNQRLRSKSN